MKDKKLKEIIGIFLSTILVLGAIFVSFNNEFSLSRASRASAFTMTLNSSNSPSISNHNATRVDDKNITWEYNNVDSYASGHVALNSQGYFGISSTSNFGITAITNVVANFNSNDNELWLLTSYDGIDWHEQCMLESGEATTLASDWRYVRFYNWSDYNTNINIGSVTIDYDCSGETSSEDVDGAHIENVITTSNTNAYAETTNVSPLGNSTRAIRFEKVFGSTYAIIGFGREYQLADIKDKRVEFDLYATVEYGKTITLCYNTTTIGSTIDSKKHTSYKILSLGDNWYHIEVHINALSSMFCSQSEGDIPAKDKAINAIKINVGNGVVDNLRIGSIPSSNVTEVGIFNQDFKTKGNTCKVSDTKNYWLKISWTGVFHSCQMVFSDNSIAEQVTGLEYPFYIHPKAVGTTNITVKLCVGYDRRYVFQAITLEVTE